MLPEGLYSFPLTPFTPQDTFARDVFAEHVEQQVAAGPAALFVACGTGEFSALDAAEHRAVVATAVEIAAGRVPVYAGVGGGPRLAAGFARGAAEAGADGLLLMPPYLVESAPAGLVAHVRHVAGATPLPLVVYQRANAVLDPPSALALLDLPTVAGIKEGRGDVDAMQRIIATVRASGHPRAESFAFVNGLPTAEVSVPAYEAIGVTGYSSAVLCFAPDIAVAFHRASTRGDVTAVRTLLAEFYVPLVGLRDKAPGYAVALPKAGARLAGLDVGPVRPPLLDATEEHVAELKDIIARGRAALAGIAAREVAA
ncbi:5-dehydro-4-deoxyglucarate dehydratase [Streptomyces sp. SPB78]|uniref:5-dehydro-4-deoxyglucarate dehydratase n=1 Tax=Streptomyces sp. (strain SPB78) TaxID=591157 RepID=UPI0001B57EEF|nr:5-dehydro-4-deoxyglucarate dehydratase [Streptomyces sp. SPB78]